MNINVLRYFECIGIEGFIKRRNRFPDNKLGTLLFNLGESFHGWLICGFNLTYDETIGRRIWNDDYHLLNKLCRYETWDNVKITWWDKLRYRIITGYKFQ